MKPKLIPIASFKTLGLSSGGIALIVILILVIPAEEKTDQAVIALQQELKQNEIDMAKSAQIDIQMQKDIDMLKELCKDSNRC